MFIKNRLFILALALTLFQQISLALSTYFIAMAGEALSLQKYSSIKAYIVYFFTFALLAYIISSVGELVRVRLQNGTWKDYVIQTFFLLRKNISLSSTKNNKMTTNWLTGEAAGTIEHAAAFYIGMSSTYFNIFFTLAVFYLTLGYLVSSALLASLIVSAAFVVMMRTKIDGYATSMQRTRLQALLEIEPLWHNCHFASSKMFEAKKTRYSDQSDVYFRTTEKYVLLEQLIACLPICVAVFIMIIAVYLPTDVTTVPLGVLVAVLPRTLQLFGSVHALSMYGSQFVIVRRKVKNLIQFTQTLETQDIAAQIDTKNITIEETTTHQRYDLAHFQHSLINNQLNVGRYLVQGNNGSGKSSFLKLIKSLPGETVLISPDINFSEPEENLSTGQRQMKQISGLLMQPADIFLLDEWDANLDKLNRNILSAEIDKVATQKVVIEVRHLNPSHVEKPVKTVG
jgi:ABC-type bacteriocin/lantibiotic exporter with double-glycine peptidase domain